MAYNTGLEDPQNWPFSVRYTASPYRKSKFPVDNGPNSVGAGGLMENTSIPHPPHHHQHHQQQQHHWAPHPSTGIPLPPYPHSSSGISSSPAGTPSHFQYQNGAAYTNTNGNYPGHHVHAHSHSQPPSLYYQQHQQYQQYCFLQQHHQLQQQYQNHVQSHGSRNGDHPYGLPLPQQPQQNFPNNQQFFVRQQPRAQKSQFHFHPAQSTSDSSRLVVDGVLLDEGYIEDLKQTGSAGPSSSQNSSFHGAPVIVNNLTGSLEYDPYSYVYDSAIHEESLHFTGSSILERLQREALASGKKSSIVSTSNSSSSSAATMPGMSQTVLPGLPSAGHNGNGHASENEYEEIRDVARYMAEIQEETGGSSDQGPGIKQRPFHFKSFSSTNDLRAEVVSVQQGHDRVLDQLNLEVENLLIRSTTEEIETENNRKLSELLFLQQQHGYSNVAIGNHYGNSGSRAPLVACHQQSQSMDSCLRGKRSPGPGTFDRFRAKGSLQVNGENSKYPMTSTPCAHNHKKSKSETCAGCSNGNTGDSSGPCSDTSSRTTVDRKKKLDRSITAPSLTDAKCLENHQQLMASLKKKVPKDKEASASNKAAKAKHHRSYSLIPHWKIRDQLMRLPFLRHNSDKSKKTESACPISAASTGTNSISASVAPVNHFLCNNSEPHQFNSGSLKKRGKKDKVVQGVGNNMTMAAIKARSSSMDELRATGTEEHWYSADSDTEPDSLTALPLPQALPDLSRANGVLSMTSSLTSLGISNHLTMSNTTPCSHENNGSRLDVSNGIQDNIPKAPKFRRGSGIKDKWRESWTQSKTLSKSNMEEDNRLLRWFSLRKNQGVNLADNAAATMNNRNSTLPQLSEEDLKRLSFNMEDEEGYWPRRTVLPPTLPVPPPNLSAERITRRHIVAAIVHSENNYVAALQRLVNEYKKPLECSHPAMLSHSKISTVFHRLPEILQCHSLFRIALAEYIRKWDTDEKIGDVFVASFSKSLVLDVYSEFINNFGQAMETAKSEARRKSAFAEFLKVKQMTAHDRLSLFGLMVKPVQRFPQFILLLQDLLKHTPKDHHDRMSLQLALTQLESLAAMLNERKRESEQYQAFRETIKSIGGGKFVLLRSVADDPNRILLRQDIVTQLEFDSNGSSVAKSKTRKLLLLNDMLICVTASHSGSTSSTERGGTSQYRSGAGVNTNSSVVNSNQNQTTTGGKVEKSVFKWSHPVREVEVEDISISPTMSRFVHGGSNGLSTGTLHNQRQKGSSSTLPVPDPETQLSTALLEEMQSLMYDYEVLSRILTLVTSLKSSYEGLTEATVKELMLEIQHQIRCRDEQISYFDSSCLTLLLGSGHNREKVVFQMQSPAARNEWIEEIRLAQLALDPNNSPAWDIPAESPYPHHKLPLFVRALPLARSPHLSTVKCGCFFTHTFVSPTGRSKILDYLWVSCTDGISSHVTAFRSQQNTLKEVSAFDLVEEKINDLLFVSGHVWVATDSRKIMVLDPSDPEKGNLCHYLLSDSVLKLTLFGDVIYAGLADGNLAVFTQIHNPKKIEPEVLIKLGSDRVPAVFGSRDHVYASCGNAVVTIDAKTHTIERNVVLTHHNGPITHMACSGVGLWISTQDSGTVCLYHLESLQHLQDVSIAPSVFRTIRDSYRRQKGCHVTCLSAHKGWLWIGTNLGAVLTIPLPRLEGVPIISTGKANVSYHGYNGPITYLMPLFKAPLPLLSAATSARAQNKNLNETPVKPPPESVLQTPINKVIPEEEHSDKFRTPINNNNLNFEEKDTTLTNTTSESRSPSLSNNSSFNSSKGDTPSKGSPQQSLASGLCGSRDGSGHDAFSSTAALGGLNKTLVILRKKNSRDNVFNRNCKTLPRGGPAVHSNVRFSIDSDVYGLYGNLINVRGLEDEGRFVDPLYDALRRSDPELVALDSKISTLDRRLKMRMSRPRSLDLSNWSVDSKISASSDESVGLGSSRSSQATDSSTPTPIGPITTTITLNGSPDPSMTSPEAGPVNASTAATTGTTKKTVSRTKAKSKAHQERTVIVVVGGRGYVNMRAQPFQDHFHNNPDTESKLCTNLTVWQMKT